MAQPIASKNSDGVDVKPKGVPAKSESAKAGSAKGLAIDRNNQSPTQATRTAILILGMHRSGTSALTRVLNLLGADLPKTVMGAGDGNETGHWEPNKLVALHERFLADAGSRWDDCRRLPLDPPSPFAKPETLAALRLQLEDDYGPSRLLVLKDPRICRFVPVYRRLLGEMGIKHVAVIPLRNPLAVAKSLVARRAVPIESIGYASLMWLRHAIEAEFATRDMPRAITSYESLLDDWRSVIRDIGDGIGIDWPLGANHAAAQIQQFLADKHAHHMPSDRALDGRDDIPDLVKQAYKALKALEARPDDTAPFTVLDAIRAQLDAADVSSNTVYAEFVARLAANEALARSREAEQAAALAATQAAAQSREAEQAAALAATQAAAQSREAEQAAALAATQAATQSREAELVASLAEREARVATLSVQATQLAVLRGEAESLRAVVGQRSADVFHLTTQCAALTASTAERDQRILTLTEQLFAARTKAVELAEEAAQRLAAVADLQAAVRAAGTRELEFSEAIASLSLELSASRTEAAQVAADATHQIATVRAEAAAELEAAQTTAAKIAQELTAEAAQLRDSRLALENALAAERARRQQQSEAHAARLAASAVEARTALEGVGAAATAEQARVRAEAEHQQQIAQQALADTRDQLSRTLRDQDALISSTTWQLTRPVRTAAGILPSGLRRFLRRSARVLWWTATLRLRSKLRERRNAMRQAPVSPVIAPLNVSTAVVALDKEAQQFNEASCLIVSPPHTLSLAAQFASELSKVGFTVAVETDLVKQSAYQHLFVLCPNVFDGIRDDYIAVQLEQTTSTRWFTEDYIEKLRKAAVVLDYSVDNIEFIKKLGVDFGKIFYVPVGADPLPAGDGMSQEKIYDVLFYGDDQCARRKELLAALSREFKIKIVNNTFGHEMKSIIRSSKVVLNLHYYEDSLLETPRLIESLSLGTPVVSETSPDQARHPEFVSVVDFAEQRDVNGLSVAIRRLLNDYDYYCERVELCRLFTKDRNELFVRYFRRFLYGTNMIGYDSFLQVADGHIKDTPRGKGLCLTLSETPERMRNFLSRERSDFVLVEGLRQRPGWVGCGLSYKFIFQNAINQGLDRLLVCEDDVSFPADYDSRKRSVDEYLAINHGEWDLFSGFIADISPETVVSKVEMYNGVQFVWIDRTVSTVYNIYTEKVMALLATWDPSNRNVEKNTIDRFMQSNPLRIIVAYPYLVGHDDDQDSTIWGINNSQYQPMLDQSASVMEKLLRGCR
jgi:hypothetical protein